MPARTGLCGFVLLMVLCTATPARQQPRSIGREAAPAGGDPAAGGAPAADAPKLVLETGGFTSAITSLDFSRDGQWLAAAGVDKAVRIWELATGRPVAVLRGQDEAAFGAANALAFSPDRRYLVVGVHDFSPQGTLRVYDTGDLGRIAQLLPAHGEGGVVELAFSDDGRYLASAGSDGQILVWDWPQRRPLKAFRFQNGLTYLGFPIPGVPALCYNDTAGPHLDSVLHGKPIDSLTPEEQQQFVQSLADPQKMATTLGRVMANVAALQQITGLPDSIQNRQRVYLDTGHVLACGMANRDGAVKRYFVSLWTPEHGAEPSRIYEGHRYVPTTMVMSPDRSLVASGDFLGNIQVWDPTTGKVRREFNGGGRSIYRVGFEPEGLRLGFGTRPHGTDRWAHNSYGDAERTFDLRGRRLSDGAAGQHLTEVTERGDRRASLVTNPEFGQLVTSSVGGRVEHLFPVEGLPWCYGLLGTNRAGFQDPLVIGTFNGELTCYDPATGISRRMFVGHAGAVTSFSESPDGRYLASSSTDRTIRVWSLEHFGRNGFPDIFFSGSGGAVRYVLPGGSAERAGIQAGDRVVTIEGQSLTQLVTALVSSRWPFRAGQRATLRVARGEQTFDAVVELVAGPDYAEPLLSLFLDGDEWVLWTPQGYYDASLGGDRLIGWHLNRGRDQAAQFFLAQQFRKPFYRPEVIDRLLETGDMARALELANQDRGSRAPAEVLDIRRADVLEKLAPPRVRILEPAAGAAISGKSVVVKAEVTPQNDQPVTEVTFLVNGRPATGAKSIDREGAPDAANRPAVMSRELELVPGRNELSVVAANATATSQPVSVVVTRAAGGEPAALPRLYVLAVGISKYQDESFDLRFAGKDAEDFAAAWKAQEGRVYAKVETRVLTDDKATTRGILEGMEWLVRSATQRDVTVLFVSAHGVRDERDNYYLGTHEIDPKSLRSTALRWSEVKNLITDIPGKFLLFVDTCHSGGITGAKAMPTDPLRELVSEDTGAVVFSSSLPREVSLESPAWGHGAFTRAILDAFGSPEADVNKDGFLSLNELNLRVTDRVKELTEGRQHTAVNWPPTITDFNFLEVGAKP